MLYCWFLELMTAYGQYVNNLINMIKYISLQVYVSRGGIWLTFAINNKI